MSDWGGFKLYPVGSGTQTTALDLNIILRPGASFPILPSTRDRTVEIPGRKGMFYFGSRLAARRFSLPCAFVFAENPTALFTHARALGAYLINDGKPRKMVLEFEADAGNKYHVYYSGRLDLTRMVFDGEFDLPLFAPDPDEVA
jgi:phage-related protein